MNRTLTHLSAAVFLAAGAGAVFAGPTFDAAVDASVKQDGTPSLIVDGRASIPSTTDLLGSTLQSGFASTDRSASGSRPVRRVFAGGPLGVETVRFLPDVSDFISPAWQRFDPAVEDFSEPVAEGEAMPFSRFALATSHDVNTLSVPEIPLPMPLIPGLVGVGLAALAHRRSLKRRNLP